MAVFSKFRKSVFGYDIFISYSRKDGLDYAYAVAQYFMKKGYECYIDQLSSIAPGQELPSNIKEAVKRSSAFVLIGSEGAQPSEPISDEINLFLENNKSKPLIPITVEGSINDNCIWFERILGLALIDDTITNLKNGTPAQDVLDRIENALTFKKKSLKLRRIFSFVLFVSLLAVVLISYLQWKSNRDSKNRQISALYAETKGFYNRTDYPGALSGLIQISKIDANKEEVFNFFEEGINECVLNDSFVAGATYLAKANELFYKSLPKKFEAVHANFLLKEARFILKDCHPTYSYTYTSDSLTQKADSANEILIGILKKVYTCPGYTDSVLNFFKNEYYPPVATSRYFLNDTDAFQLVPLSFSYDGSRVAFTGLKYVHVNEIFGASLIKEELNQNYLHKRVGRGGLPVLFSAENKEEYLTIYQRDPGDDDTPYAILNTKKTFLISNPKFISSEGYELHQGDIYVNHYCYYKISGDSVFLRNHESVSFSRSALNPEDEPINDSTKIYIHSANHQKTLRLSRNSAIIETKNSSVRQAIPLYDPVMSQLTYANDSSALLVTSRSDDSGDSYLFDKNLNLLAVLRFCSRPIIIRNEYIIDASTQNVWATNPINLFIKRNQKPVPSTDQKRKYGIEFN